MSRTAKGTIERGKDFLRVRVTVVDDNGETYRPWVDVPPRLTDDAARRVALRYAEERKGKPRERLVRGRKMAPSPTWDEYFTKLWAPSREGKIESLDDDIGRWNNHIKPLMGQLEMLATTTEHLRRVVESLDTKARAAEFPQFGAGSAVKCWTIVTTMCDEAVNSKIEKLRLLKVNPAIGVKPPDPPGDVEKQWLFPRELEKLLACKAVPLERRRLYAAATYCYTRPGEALALLWRAGIDLEHGMVRVNRAWNSRKKRFNEYTKTEDSRHFRMEPVLRPMFEAMFKRRRTELVFTTFDKLAVTLRADLLTAGVDRPALHKPKPGAELMRFHDLRATGITYMALRGDPDNDIRERAGHADFTTTQIYIRRGHQALGASIGAPFFALPDELCGIVRESSGGASGGDPGNGAVVKAPENASPEGAARPEKGFKSLLPLQESETLSGVSGKAKPTGDDSGDDLASLLGANAERGRRLAALYEADQAAARPGLSFCRGVEAAYRGDEEATLAALVDVYHALELDTPDGRERLSKAAGGAGG
ncbi:MAG TPA: tyrosine-type recombinase/integrase [Polyangiaceae bacterium]|nr:tyrosine-type recombinase/integrase [Polyangiaceae bacterium]